MSSTEVAPGGPPLPSPEPHSDEHYPNERQYVFVALVLAVATGIEVAASYIKGIERFLVPLLLVLAVFKFALVALWFMHLRFDSKVFRRLFLAGIVIALAVYPIALFSLHVLR